MTIQFFVPGKSFPGGSKIPGRNKKTGKLYCRDAGGKNTKNWRAVVTLYAGQVRPEKLFSGPLQCEMTFYRRRPQGHYLKSGALNPKAAKYPTVQPDVLKLARAVEDALTGIIYVDDSLIVDERLCKQYSNGRTPGVMIVVREIGDGM